MRRLCLLLLLLTFSLKGAASKPDPGMYGLSADSVAAPAAAIQAAADSLLQKPFAHFQSVSRIESYRLIRDRTPDFYLLLGLCILLGAIRFSDARYFGLLLRALRNAATIRGGLREGIQGAVISNFLMNVFFAVVAGAYLFYLVQSFGNPVSGYVRYGKPGLLLACICGMLLIYLIKYAVIRFSGWAFRVQAITDQYIFNVFLINKAIGIVLLPFVVLLAFADPVYAYSLAGISLLAAGLLFTLRYVRSWPVFATFFAHSRFHFFTYLCASEILPMAIIVKLLLHYAA